MPRIAPEMKTALAQQAFELFSEQGVANVSIDDIAAASGVTKGSFYHHYANKDEVVLAAARCYYQYYQQRIYSIMSEESDPVKRLHKVLREAIRGCIIDPKNRRFTIELFSLSISNPEIRESWSMFVGSVRQTYIGLVQSVCASGELKIRNVSAVVDVMLATMEGVKLRSVYEPPIADEARQDQIFNDLYSVLFPEKE